MSSTLPSAVHDSVQGRRQWNDGGCSVSGNLEG